MDGEPVIFPSPGTDPSPFGVRDPIQRIFSKVPETYERINHVLTFGLDTTWRRRAVGAAIRRDGLIWLDVCTGTGETALMLSRKAPSRTCVFAADFTRPMLTAAAGKPGSERIRFIQTDVRRMPFPDRSFDLITLTFATRNLDRSRGALVRTFAEFRRILKPDGRFVNLETSQPARSIVRNLFHAYVRLSVQKIGSVLSGSDAAYAYLARTIPRFYNPAELSNLLLEAGFRTARFRRLFFGAAAVHTAER